MQEPYSGETPRSGEPLPGSSTQGYPPQQPYSPQNYPPQNFPPPGYPPPSNGFVQQHPSPMVPADQGLSDTAAGALAYVTIIPAIIFLVLAPYNTRPFVKFHAVQCLALAVTGFCLGLIAVIPVLGWIVWLLGSLCLAVVWILSIIKASQGSYLNLPVISEFASKQSGFPIL